MVKYFYFLLIFCISLFSLIAQERVLLHIGPDGKQEAIPLQKGENVRNVIERIERQRANNFNTSAGSAGLVDTIQHFPTSAMDVITILNTNFGFGSQDIAMQWYTPEAGGVVKEFWWRNYQKRGQINKGTIRAWYVDPRLTTRPASIITRYLGFYKDPTDGAGLVTPFKPKTGNQWFYSNGMADSATWRFDPLGTEAPWLEGGVQVSLDSSVWQSISLLSSGDSLKFAEGQLFGFTLSNDSQLELDLANDVRMEILSWPKTNPGPYHSFKWYEIGRNSVTGVPPVRDAGWHMRGDYEWGMFVIVEYTSDRGPKISIPIDYRTIMHPTPRLITATVTDDNPSGGVAGVANVRLFHKKGVLSSYDSVAMANTNGSQYSASTPSATIGDTIYWYITAVDVNGNRNTSPVKTYKIFKQRNSNLLVYNNNGFSENNARLIYLYNASGFDFWSAPNDGVEELGSALELYNNVVVGDGAFPSRNIYPSIEAWLKTGTAVSKKRLFFASQDYGCIIDPNCEEITFTAGQWQYDFLGIEKLGPQDLLGEADVNIQKPFKLVPQNHGLVNYINTYNLDSGTALYYDPYSQLMFKSYPDAITPKANAVSLFKDHTNTHTLAINNSGSTFDIAFFAFDVSYALTFRSDTSVSPSNDPKFGRLGYSYSHCFNLATRFFYYYCIPDDVENEQLNIFDFSLKQNYPNPFNPSSTIEFSVANRERVQISIYNLLGQKVATLLDEQKEAGVHTTQWNAHQFASGLYFYEMRAGAFTNVKKMLLLK